LYLASRVLRIDDLVADFDFHSGSFVPLSSVRPEPTATTRPFLGLFFGGVGQENAAGRFFSLLDVLDDQTIAQRLEIHAESSVKCDEMVR
jgi:hypothetical protein